MRKVHAKAVYNGRKTDAWFPQDKRKHVQIRKVQIFGKFLTDPNIGKEIRYGIMVANSTKLDTGSVIRNC